MKQRILHANTVRILYVQTFLIGDNEEKGLSFPFIPNKGGQMGGTCSEICGDGKMIGIDECDDGN